MKCERHACTVNPFRLNAVELQLDFGFVQSFSQLISSDDDDDDNKDGDSAHRFSQPDRLIDLHSVVIQLLPLRPMFACP